MEWNIANLSFEMRSTLFFVPLLDYGLFNSDIDLLSKKNFSSFFLLNHFVYYRCWIPFLLTMRELAIIRVTIIGFLLVAMLRINPERIKAREH